MTIDDDPVDATAGDDLIDDDPVDTTVGNDAPGYGSEESLK